MVDQVHLEVAWLPFIPGDVLHGDVLGQPIDAARSSPGKAGLFSWDCGQDALSGGDADLAQLLQQCRGGLQFIVSGQVFSHPNQVGGEALGTGVVEALGDDG